MGGGGGRKGGHPKPPQLLLEVLGGVDTELHFQPFPGT